MLLLGAPMWGLKTWAGNFFPAGSKPKDFLALYSRRLHTVEGNTVFYALPDAATVERWRDEMPPGFKFCFKFPQSISHRKRLINTEAETRSFLDRLERLGDRCGPAFLQLPPALTGQHLPALSAYLEALPRDFQYAVEARHADFFGGEAEARLDDLLHRHGVARVIFDTTALFALPEGFDADVRAAQKRKPKFPARHTRTAPFAFVRFVGQPGVEANRAWLLRWADRAAEWLQNGDDVYFFLHNPDDMHSPAMARLLHGLVSERVPLPPLPNESATDDSPRQASLF